MLRIMFETDGSTFDEDLSATAANLLSFIAERIRAGATDGTVKDLNGNRIGEWVLTTQQHSFLGTDTYCEQCQLPRENWRHTT